MFSYEPLVKTLKERGVSLEELAEKTGLHYSYLVARLNGGEYLPVEFLDRICSALKGDISSVMMWKEGEQNDSERVAVSWNKVSSYLEKSNLSLNKLSEQCRLSKGALSIARKRGGTLKKTVANSIAKNLNCKLEDIVD